MEGELWQVIQLVTISLHNVTRSKSGANVQLDSNEINPRQHGNPGDNAEGMSPM